MDHGYCEKDNIDMSQDELSSVVYLVVIMMVTYLFYKPNQKKLFLRASNRYVVFVSMWFFIWSAALVSQAYMHLVMNWYTAPLFIAISALWFVSPYLVRLYGHAPDPSLSESPTRILIRFEPKIYVAKYFEILFQQSMFVYILFVLLFGMPYWQIILWFTLIVGFIHLLNFPFTGAKDTLFYFYLSLPMAILFGILILQGNVFISMIIHLVFYLTFNGRHWFILRKQTDEI